MSLQQHAFEVDRFPPWLARAKPKRQTLGSMRPGLRSHSFNAEFLRSLGDEIVAFAEWAQPTDHEQQVRQAFVDHVKDIVHKVWPSAQLKVYGSSETGLALPVSDVDFVVDNAHPKHSLRLPELSAALQEHGMENVRAIKSAKVPLIKFADPRSKLCGDISFNVPNATESVELVRSYMAEFPAARPLVLVLKTLLHQNSLNVVHRGGLGSHAVTLLVVSFLKVMRSSCSERDRAALEALDGFAVGNALVAFMKYFATTDLRNHIFSPAKNDPVSVVSSTADFARSSAHLVLEDPLDATNDISRGAYMIAQVQMLMWYSLQALARYPTHGYGLIPSTLSAIINPRDVHFLSRVAACNDEREQERGQ